MKLTTFFQKRSAQLAFSLACGVVYFIIFLRFVNNNTSSGYGWLLAAFFCPAVVCGGALFFIKLIRRWLDMENQRALKILFWAHCILAVCAVVFVVDMLV